MLRAVEQHVHRQHEDQHEVEDRALTRFGQQAAAEGERVELDALDDFVLERLQRRLALLDELHVDAVLVEVALQVVERLVGFVDEVRQVVAERVDLVGDRVGERASRCRPSDRKKREVDERAPRARGDSRGAAGSATTGLRISAMSAATMKITALCPRLSRAPRARAAPAAAAPAGPSAGRRARRLVAADSRRGRHELAAPRLVGGAASGPCSAPSVTCLPPSARVWLSAEAAVGDRRAREILFVGDLVGGLGRRTLLDCLPRAARALRADVRRRQRARTSPAGSGSRRRSPTSCSRPAST